MFFQFPIIGSPISGNKVSSLQFAGEAPEVPIAIYEQWRPDMPCRYTLEGKLGYKSGPHGLETVQTRL